MKKTFFAGLATLLPITLTLMVIVFFIDLLTAPFMGFAKEVLSHYGGEIIENHRFAFLIISRIIILIFFIMLIFLIGFLGRRLFFSWIVRWTNKLFIKIPIVKSIYRISRDITKNIFSEKHQKSLFKGIAIVPFPHQKTTAFGLISGDVPTHTIQNKRKEMEKKNLKSVFVPTAPHPISGFLLLYANDDIKTVDIKTEDLFKFLLSCGISQPHEKYDQDQK